MAKKRRLLHAFEVEAELRGATPEEVLQKLDRYQSIGLVKLVDSQVDFNAQAAIDILRLRGDIAILAEGVASKAISTRSGRLRALRALHSFGNNCPAAREAYLAAINDSSSDVVAQALLGLACLQDDSVVARLKEERDKLWSYERRTAQRFERAIQALEQKDPRVYEPNLPDAT